MKPFVLLAAGLLLLAGQEWPEMAVPRITWSPVVVAPPAPAPAPSVATAAVYVYEKDSGAVSPEITAGINRLNVERKIVATLFEDDTTDGGGDVPEQYRTALDAARRAGEPALVVLSGSTVLAVVPNPSTADEIVRAVP